jgi:hypothetical protein
MNEEIKKPSWLLLCCGCNTALAILGAAIAYFVFGIIFLIHDRGKGGECAESQQVKYIYIYCYMSIVVRGILSYMNSRSEQSLNQLEENLLDNAEAQKAIQQHKMNRAIANMIINWFLSLGFIIFGSIIFFDPLPCPQFRKLGLYKWALVTFYLDVVFAILVILAVIILVIVRKFASNDSETTVVAQAEATYKPPQQTYNFPWTSPQQADISPLTPPLAQATLTPLAVSSLNVMTNTQSESTWSVCNHWMGQFHLAYFSTEVAARIHYINQLGSKLLARGTTIVETLVSSEQWGLTVGQYWLVKQEIVRLGRSGIIPATSYTGWAVCAHQGPTEGFTFTRYDNEAEAREAYIALPYFSTRILSLGRQVVEKWSMTPSWDLTLRQYWEAYIEAQVLRMSSSPTV